MDKKARLVIFYQQLSDAPPVSTHDEAYELLCTVLNRVEDEHSGIPNNPENWETDGRLYPPQLDSVRKIDDDLLRYRSSKHNTYIASNGAIEVCSVNNDEVLFAKAGANGKGVRDAQKTSN